MYLTISLSILCCNFRWAISLKKRICCFQAPHILEFARLAARIFIIAGLKSSSRAVGILLLTPFSAPLFMFLVSFLHLYCLAGNWVSHTGNVISLHGYSYSAVHFGKCETRERDMLLFSSFYLVDTNSILFRQLSVTSIRALHIHRRESHWWNSPRCRIFSAWRA